MLVFFLVLNKPPQKAVRAHDQNGMSGMLQKEVGFSKDQVDTYLSLRKSQMDTIHVLFDDLRKSKMDFYDLIYASQLPDSSLNEAADLIAERQKISTSKCLIISKRFEIFVHPINCKNLTAPLKKYLSE